MKFYPYKGKKEKKKGGGVSFSHADGGGGGGEAQKVLRLEVGLVLAWELGVLAILKGGAKSFYSSEGGGAKSCILSWGRGGGGSDPQFSNFVG